MTSAKSVPLNKGNFDEPGDPLCFCFCELLAAAIAASSSFAQSRPRLVTFSNDVWIVQAGTNSEAQRSPCRLAAACRIAEGFPTR